jgi:hypothetical protein
MFAGLFLLRARPQLGRGAGTGEGISIACRRRATNVRPLCLHEPLFWIILPVPS